MPCYRKEKEWVQDLDDLISFPACWLGMIEALGRVRLLRILVLAHERVWVLLLIEIAELDDGKTKSACALEVEIVYRGFSGLALKMLLPSKR